ncbi:MAG: aminomethyl-transferring glycine dehydrogenase subunit GcvPA [Gammaproteobacteria bacterium]
MPFVPHTDQDCARMLETLGVACVDALFDEIPEALRVSEPLDVLPALDEMSLWRLMQERAEKDRIKLSFLGAGAYEHYIPAAVWDIVGRGEFMTAYTPYQAEASQGTLQVTYEFQTMMCRLTGMAVSNASLYDGASALAEAILMSVRANRKNKTGPVLVPENVHPFYRQTCETLVRAQGVVLETIPCDRRSGLISMDHLQRYEQHGDEKAPVPTAVVISQPNFFGGIENPDALTDWAHERGAIVIAVVNPISLALLKPPGEWGKAGADIVVGEGQALGMPLSSGGPYFGFMCSTKALMRQMPGRIIGRTVDQSGRHGFVLTLQAREQHIRRAKATSNICTNQGLAVTAATLYMSLLGSTGLRSVALRCHQRLKELLSFCQTTPGVTPFFTGAAVFHETVLRLPVSAEAVCARLSQSGILAGLPLQQLYPQIPGSEFGLLVCTTEKHTSEDLHRFGAALAQAISAQASDAQASDA